MDADPSTPIVIIIPPIKFSVRDIVTYKKAKLGKQHVI